MMRHNTLPQVTLNEGAVRCILKKNVSEHSQE